VGARAVRGGDVREREPEMVKITQNSFLGGQLDFEMMGRQDVDKYSRGATRLVNFLPLKRGGIRKRPGTDLRHTVTTAIGSGKYRLVPFAYKRGEGWALLFTNGAILAFNRSGTVEVVAQGADFYTGAQIEELDYCQCGDVLFIAHQGHAPAKIEHTVSGNTHTFTLKTIDLNTQKDGRPWITAATVTKMAVTTNGAPAKETYKVTAVYDGQESFASAAFSKAAPHKWASVSGSGYEGKCVDYAEEYNQWRKDVEKKEAKGKVSSLDYQAPLRSYEGTEYTMPWTQSQKISLHIKLPRGAANATDARNRARYDANGTRMYPEQIRIYRKTGSVYGLVGHIDTSDSVATTTAQVSADSQYANDATVARIDATSGTPLGNGIADGGTLAAHGLGVDGFSVTYGEGTGKMLTLKLPATVHSAKVTITPGAVSRTETQGTVTIDGEATTALATIAYTYHRCPAGTFQAKFLNIGDWIAANAAIARASTAGDTGTYTAERNAEEDEGAFRERADREFQRWLAANYAGDTAEVVIEGLTAGSGASDELDILRIRLWNGSTSIPFTVAGIRVDGTPYQKSEFDWDDKYFTPDASVTPPKRELVMNEAGEYPACVCLSQQRLIWASTANEPARVVMSQTGNFDVYAPHDVMVDDDPVDFQVSATRFPKVNHMVELRKLLLFNGDSEWVVDSASAASGITYATVQARQHSSIGAADWLKPLVCNNVLLFAERTGQAVRQYGYQLEDDGYGGDDISIFSASIFRGKRIVDWAYQQHPHSTCWCVLSDGTLCSLTFMREQNTIAWATHALGGGGKARAIVATHALTGNANTLADTTQVFLLVERGGAWTVEELRRDCRHGRDTVANAVCLDSARVLAAGATRRAGTVAIDPMSGRALAGNAVTAGAIEGYVYESEFTSVYPVVASEVGLAQMDVKCVQAAHLRMADAVGGAVRGAAVPADEASRLENTSLTVRLNAEQPSDIEGAEPEYSGVVEFAAEVDENVPLVTSNNRDGRVTVSQSEPWPFTLLMLETDVECEESTERSRR